MKKWNCQVIQDNELPFDIAKFRRQIDGVAVRIPVRENGLTSSGRKGGCYYNVNIATKLFGGKSLAGWSIRNMNANHSNITYKLLGHAVWLNDENRASCITAKSWGSEHFIKSAGRHCIDMIIWKELDTRTPYLLKDIILMRDKIRRRTNLVCLDEKMQVLLPLDKLTDAEANYHFIDHYNNVLESEFETKLLNKHPPQLALQKIIEGYEEVAGFNERSVATGMSYEEIKIERILRSTAY